MVALVEYELVFCSIELDVNTQRREHQCKSADLGKRDSLGSSRGVTGMVVYMVLNLFMLINYIVTHLHCSHFFMTLR